MRPLTASTQTQQWLAFFVPVIALLISILIVYPAWGSHRELGRDISQKRDELQKLQSAILPAMNQGIPAVDTSAGESSQFIADIRQLGARSGSVVMGYDTSKVSDEATANGIRSLQTSVSLRGNYKQIRSFLWLITHNPRFLTVTNSLLELDESTLRDDGRPLTASITIERYVEAPTAAGLTPAPKGAANPP